MNHTTSIQESSVTAHSSDSTEVQTNPGDKITGGCACGQLRYEATRLPIYAGYCCCLDCRRSSGSGFVGYMAFHADAIHFTGETMSWHTTSLRGKNVLRQHCAKCGSLVFGTAEDYTVFAGSLDNPEHFKPTTAVFNRSRPSWTVLPDGLQVFETMPG